MARTDADRLTLRHELQPGDLGEIVRLHGVLYAAEHGFDPTFEAYVAGPFAEFALGRTPRDRLWIADAGDGRVAGRVAGCVAIVGTSATEAQLRWFLVDPAFRGRGLGTRLLREAVAFAGEAGYRTVCLWTVAALAPAARLYRAAGFEKVEERPGRRWGVDVVEERYLRRLERSA